MTVTSKTYSATRPALPGEPICMAPDCPAPAWIAKLCHNHYGAARASAGKVLGLHGQAPDRGRIDPRKLSPPDLERALTGMLGQYGAEVACPRAELAGTASRRDVFLLVARQSAHWSDDLETLVAVSRARGVRQRMAARIEARSDFE